MKIARLSIAGFGCLRDLDLDFGPGLTLITGPNEAGKSTLQQALLRTLFGFYLSGHTSKDARERHECFRPWNGGPFRTQAILHCDSGRQISIERDFSAGNGTTSQVRDELTGASVIEQFRRGSRGWVEVVETILGMDYQVFTGTAFLSQLDFAPDKVVPAIRGHLLKIADTAGGDVSADGALQLLEKTRDKIGVHRAASGALYVSARALAADRRAELSHIRQVRGSIAQDLQEVESLEEEVKGLSSQQMAGRWVQLQRQREALAARIHSIKDLEAKRDELQGLLGPLQRVASFPLSLVAEVEGQRTLLQARRQALNEGETGAREDNDQSGKISADLDEVRRALADLQFVRDFSAEDEAEVRQMAARLGAMKNSFASLREELQQVEKCIDEHERELQASAEIVDLLHRLAPEDLATRRAIRSNLVQQIESQQADIDQTRQRLGLPIAVDAEAKSLEARLAGLDEAELGRLQQLHNQVEMMRATSPRRPATSLRYGLWVAIAMLVVLGPVLVLLNNLAAGILLVGLGLACGAGAIVMQRSTSLAGAKPGTWPAGMARAEADLRAALSRYQVETIDELQRLHGEVGRLRIGVAQVEAIARQREASQARLAATDRELADQLGNTLPTVWGDSDLKWVAGQMHQVQAVQERLQSQEQRRDELQRRVDEAAAAQAKLAGSILQRVSCHGIPTADLEQALSAYYRHCVKKREYEGLLQQEKLLSARLERVRERQHRRRSDAYHLQGVEDQLRAALERCGIGPGPDDLEQALQDFDRAYQDKLRYDSLNRDLRNVQQRLADALGGASLNQLEFDLDTLSRRLAAISPPAPALPSGSAGLGQAELEDELSLLDAGIHSRRERIAGLRARAEHATEGLREPAAVEEEVEAAEAEADRLEELQLAVEIAAQVIEEASAQTKKQYAPQLQAFLQPHLVRITKQRYTAVRVSPDDLAVRLTAAGDGRTVEMHEVSQGTQDLIYILLRVSIADYMSQAGETVPLLLDDPFVNLDEDRLRSMLELLGELCAERQVVLFSKDIRTAEMMRSMGIHYQHIEMPDRAG